MRNFRKVFIALLVVSLLASGSLIAHAYTYIAWYSSGLTISSGTATCAGGLYTQRSGDTGSITVTLKKETSAGVWSSVTSWSATATDYVSLSKTKSVTSGYRYKVTVKGTVKGESVTIDSPIKTY